jgi:hypothetical protein
MILFPNFLFDLYAHNNLYCQAWFEKLSFISMYNMERYTNVMDAA